MPLTPRQPSVLHQPSTSCSVFLPSATPASMVSFQSCCSTSQFTVETPERRQPPEQFHLAAMPSDGLSQWSHLCHGPHDHPPPAALLFSLFQAVCLRCPAPMLLYPCSLLCCSSSPQASTSLWWFHFFYCVSFIMELQAMMNQSLSRPRYTVLQGNFELDITTTKWQTHNVVDYPVNSEWFLTYYWNSLELLWYNLYLLYHLQLQRKVVLNEWVTC